MPKVLFDTNIILDAILKRPGLYQSSSKVLKMGSTGEMDGFVFSSSIKDLFYLLRKDIPSVFQRKEVLLRIVRALNVVPCTERDIMLAFSSEVADYEDAIVDEACFRESVDLIVTRNVKDFAFSKVRALTPEQFLLEQEGESHAA